MLTNEEILELAKYAGFEFNDFGKWNCTTDAILELVGEIDLHYGIKMGSGGKDHA